MNEKIEPCDHNLTFQKNKLNFKQLDRQTAQQIDASRTRTDDLKQSTSKYIEQVMNKY